MEDEIFVDREEVLNDPSGILRIPIEHETPESHMLVVDVDASGFVRSAYLIRKYITIENIPVIDAIKITGIKNFSRILGWLLAYDNIYLYGHDKEIVKWIRIVLTHVFGSDNKIVSESKAKIRIDVFNVKAPDFSVDIIERRLKIGIDNIKNNKALVAYIRNEILKYVKYLSLFRKHLLSVKKASIKNLVKLTNNELGEYEVKLLMAILKLQGIDVDKKVSCPEIKMIDLL